MMEGEEEKGVRTLLHVAKVEAVKGVLEKRAAYGIVVVISVGGLSCCHSHPSETRIPLYTQACRNHIPAYCRRAHSYCIPQGGRLFEYRLEGESHMDLDGRGTLFENRFSLHASHLHLSDVHRQERNDHGLASGVAEVDGTYHACSPPLLENQL